MASNGHSSYASSLRQSANSSSSRSILLVCHSSVFELASLLQSPLAVETTLRSQFQLLIRFVDLDALV